MLPIYDPLDPATLADPYPVLARLRETSPVFWHEGMQAWCLTRYKDCVGVLRDHRAFARDRRRLGQDVPEPSLSVQSLDPPKQAPIRRLFLEALLAQDLAALQQRALDRLLTMFRELSPRGAFDVMTDVASPLALAVISDLLGVEEPDLASFAEVSDAILRSMDAGLSPAAAEPGRLARRELSLLVESWFATSGRPGLLANVRARAHGDHDIYVRNTARVMFQGGYSTIKAAVGNALHTLMAFPDDLHAMQDESILRSGVDELIRFDGPVQGTSRVATSDVDVGGTCVHAGDTVVTLFAAANRDPEQFADADELRLRRSPNRHLGYGWGAHSCIGSIPARSLLCALITSLLAQPAPLIPAGSAQRRRTATMRTFDTLPATFAA